ncbi:MAG: hypothetical protein GIW95_07665 [Candidatus Eremiobacteraeota bacterium]|nr:hypothetical protein [Candidatus Eremiobacteraeota bacterium]
MDPSTDAPVLTLLPEVEARRALSGSALSFAVLAPPFPAIGIGTLRVLRVSTLGATTEIVAGYDRYERLPEAPK